MKNLFIDQFTAEQIEIVCEQRKNEERTRVAQYAPKINGGVVFEYNRKTREMKPAVFRHSKTFDLMGNNNPQLDTTPNCLYIEAVNIDNAHKRLTKGKFFHKS